MISLGQQSIPLWVSLLSRSRSATYVCTLEEFSCINARSREELTENGLTSSCNSPASGSLHAHAVQGMCNPFIPCS